MFDTVFDGALVGWALRVASWCSSGNVSALHVLGSMRLKHTRHTTTPHRWQSPTMSRAHLPIRPLELGVSRSRLGDDVILLVAAMECMLDELVTVLE
jgi:hypothetical protein